MPTPSPVGEGYRNEGWLLADEDDNERHNEGVNSYRFCEAETEDHGLADVAGGVRVAPDRLRRAPRTDTKADTRAHVTQTNREAGADQLGTVCRVNSCLGQESE